MANQWQIKEVDVDQIPRRRLGKWHALRQEVLLRLERTHHEKALIFPSPAPSKKGTDAVRKAIIAWVDAHHGRGSVVVETTMNDGGFAEWPKDQYPYLIAVHRSQDWELKTPRLRREKKLDREDAA